MLIVRLRDGPRGSFLEFFVEVQDDKLCMPGALGRFKSRTLLSTSIKTIDMSLVESKALGVTKKTKGEIKKNGAWISYGDCLLRGGYVSDTINVPSRRVFFGIPIDDSFADFILKNIFEIYAAVPQAAIKNEPYVVYHGTGQDSVKAILENGLRPSKGMLGNCIYFGTFWKSWRFAVMTQDYTKRPGAILRLYAFWQRPVIKTPQSDRCLCSECKGLKPPPADHDAKWSLLGDFVIAPPNAVLKNEEYACLTNADLIIDSVGHCFARGEHHEPLDRSMIID